MARNINISQFKNKLNQTINKLNSDARRLENEYKRNVNKINQEIRQHNNQVRANRQKLINALYTFKNHSHRPAATIQYSVELQQSVYILNTSYERLESRITRQHSGYDHRLLLELPEQENTNSLFLYNSLMGNDEDDGQSERDLDRTAIEDLLYESSPEFCNRWKGAIFALKPGNPEAARHFCSSAREICIGILNIHAPDREIMAFPNYELTPDGKPTRRSKIKYLLNRKSIRDGDFETFIEEDINSALQLFHVLNSGTHGHVGIFEVPQLLKLKKRVEDFIFFLKSILS